MHFHIMHGKKSYFLDLPLPVAPRTFLDHPPSCVVDYNHLQGIYFTIGYY